jgi:hypothetical protein
MRLTLSAAGAPLGVPARWLLFGAAVIAGAVSGNTINIEPLGRVYNGLFMLYAEPGIQIASLAAGVGLGFVLGLIHLTSI